MYFYLFIGFVQLCLIAYYYSPIIFSFSKNKKSLYHGYQVLSLVISILKGLVTWLANVPSLVYDGIGIVFALAFRWFHTFFIVVDVDHQQPLVYYSVSKEHQPPQTTIFDRKDPVEVDWLELPDHILYLIAIKLIHIKDYIHFGVVCQSWRSVYIQNQRNHLPRQPALLMLPTELNKDDNQTRSFYSLVEKRVLNFRVPVPHDRFCAGSSHGWLVLVSTDWEITLLNPFLSVNNVIELPPATTFGVDGINAPTYDFDNILGYVAKVVLSANPASNPGYVVIAIYGEYRHLAFYKSGDKAWTDLDEEYINIMDVVYFRDQFYFVNDIGTVFAYDLNHSPPRVSTVAPSLVSLSAYRRYLVESSGELLHVCRFTDFESDDEPDYIRDGRPKDYFNVGFDVFKLDLVAAKYTNVMDNLQGHVLFLGDNYSYSLSALDFTECKPSIYYTDDYYEGYVEMEEHGLGPHDMGIFNLEDRTNEPHYPTNSKMIIPAPIWIEPTL